MLHGEKPPQQVFENDEEKDTEQEQTHIKFEAWQQNFMSGNKLSQKHNNRNEKIHRLMQQAENFITAQDSGRGTSREDAFKSFANCTRNTAKTHQTQQTVVTNNTIVENTELTSLSGSLTSQQEDKARLLQNGTILSHNNQKLKSAGTGTKHLNQSKEDF